MFHVPSVCVSVSGVLWKNGRLDRYAVWDGGNHKLDGGAVCHVGKDNFGDGYGADCNEW